MRKVTCNHCQQEVIESKTTPFGGLKDKTYYMCDDCRKANGMETPTEIMAEIKANIKTPSEIVKALDEVVVGQERAKKVLAVEIYNHFLRIVNQENIVASGKKLKKNNILLTGPSGTGKTLIAETLANILGVPFAIADATSLTETGYVGSDVETIVLNLLKKSNMNINKAQYGIIYLDEVDKIAKKGENLSITRDVSGEGVQQALLKLVEGHKVGVPASVGRKHPQEKLIEVDTSNILFICGGAFVGIEDIVKKRLNISDGKASIGFNSAPASQELATDTSVRPQIDTEDLQKYGMIPEFLGRFPVVANLEPLDTQQLIDILKVKNGALEEYETLFQLQDKELHFDMDALTLIATMAIKRGTGARGLKSIISSFMTDLMFEVPEKEDKHYRITKPFIDKFYGSSEDEIKEEPYETAKQLAS